MRVLEWLWDAANALKREKQRSIALADQLEKSTKMLEEISHNTTLISINKSGRQVVFTFMRYGEIHRINCYASVDFNLDYWCKTLTEKR